MILSQSRFSVAGAALITLFFLNLASGWAGGPSIGVERESSFMPDYSTTTTTTSTTSVATTATASITTTTANGWIETFAKGFLDPFTKDSSGFDTWYAGVDINFPSPYPVYGPGNEETYNVWAIIWGPGVRTGAPQTLENAFNMCGTGDSGKICRHNYSQYYLNHKCDVAAQKCNFGGVWMTAAEYVAKGYRNPFDVIKENTLTASQIEAGLADVFFRDYGDSSVIPAGAEGATSCAQQAGCVESHHQTAKWKAHVAMTQMCQTQAAADKFCGGTVYKVDDAATIERLCIEGGNVATSGTNGGTAAGCAGYAHAVVYNEVHGAIPLSARDAEEKRYMAYMSTDWVVRHPGKSADDPANPYVWHQGDGDKPEVHQYVKQSKATGKVVSYFSNQKQCDNYNARNTNWKCTKTFALFSLLQLGKFSVPSYTEEYFDIDGVRYYSVCVDNFCSVYKAVSGLGYSFALVGDYLAHEAPNVDVTSAVFVLIGTTPSGTKMYMADILLILPLLGVALIVLGYRRRRTRRGHWDQSFAFHRPRKAR